MKISIIGGGNAGCFTALYYSSQGKEVELIHNPDVSPVTVGQGTIPGALKLLHNTTSFNWYDNKVHATPKTGFLYDGWGKVNDKVMHPFPAENMAMHFCPHEMQREILKSDCFKVIEGDVDPKDVDADYVFDCRGGLPNEYEELISPVNAVILGKPNWNTLDALWTTGVATPDGWCFIIPMHLDSPSHKESVGYVYNDTITPQDEAQRNFLDLFDVEITRNLKFNSYVAMNPIVDNRIILQGNRLFFLEPLESTAVESYLHWSRVILYATENNISFHHLSGVIKEYIRKIQNFILWHYQFGSKYDTPFWKYAKSLFSFDPEFNNFVDTSINMNWDEAIDFDNIDYKSLYAQWSAFSFKYWHEGMNIHKRE